MVWARGKAWQQIEAFPIRGLLSFFLVRELKEYVGTQIRSGKTDEKALARKAQPTYEQTLTAAIGQVIHDHREKLVSHSQASPERPDSTVHT